MYVSWDWKVGVIFDGIWKFLMNGVFWGRYLVWVGIFIIYFILYIIVILVWFVIWGDLGIFREIVLIVRVFCKFLRGIVYDYYC